MQSLWLELIMNMDLDKPVDEKSALPIFFLTLLTPVDFDELELHSKPIMVDATEPQLLHLLAPLGLLAVEVAEDVVWVPPQVVIPEDPHLANFRGLRLRHILYALGRFRDRIVNRRLSGAKRGRLVYKQTDVGASGLLRALGDWRRVVSFDGLWLLLVIVFDPLRMRFRIAVVFLHFDHFRVTDFGAF